MADALTFPVPGKLYFKKGSLPVALRELRDVYRVSRAAVYADEAMRHDGRIGAVTCVLQDLGLSYAVNSASFAAEAAIAFGSHETWSALPETGLRIIIPTAIDTLGARAWRSADMVILDEDVLHDDTPLPVQKWRTLDNARRSLQGANASDYTLAWAVQAMRLVLDGDDSTETLLHAAALARLAYSAAVPGDEPETEVRLDDAAAALGMTPAALHERLFSAMTAADRAQYRPYAEAIVTA